MNDYYDMREPMKEILKTQGGKDFFKELNAARIPFLFIAATANSEEKTEYFCESITPNAMDICLTDDKFADLLNIRNHGFVAVPGFSLVFADAERMEHGEKKEDKKDDKAPETKGTRAESANNGRNRDVTEADMIDAVIKSVIQQQNDTPQQSSGQEVLVDDTLPLDSVSKFHSEELLIEWGSDPNPHESCKENDAEVDEQHRDILKGDGSFLKEKEKKTSHRDIT